MLQTNILTLGVVYFLFTTNQQNNCRQLKDNRITVCLSGCYRLVFAVKNVLILRKNLI